MLLAASVSFLSPAVLTTSRNNDRNATSTRYKALIQFWKFSIANLVRATLIKNITSLPPEAMSDEELEQIVNVWTRKRRRIAV